MEATPSTNLGETSAAGAALPAPGPQKRQGGWHLAEWLSELIGTAILLIGGLSAVALDFHRGSPVITALPARSPRLLLTGLLFAGVGSLVAVSPLGRRSGGHINPAVTVAFWIDRRVHIHDLIGYVGSQIVGGVIGAAVFRLLWRGMAGQVGYGVTMPGAHVAPITAAAIEAAMTATLLLTIFCFVSSARTARWTPVAVWLLVATFVWQVAPLTGTSLNPARSIGPAVAAGNQRFLWIYLIGPLVGGMSAAAIWRLVPRSVLTAKLFHDETYPSVMATDLPAMPPAKLTAR